MRTATYPDTEPDTPISTAPQRSGGWLRGLQRRVKLALGGDDEELTIVNQTTVSWRIYHDYHQLGIIDPHERLTYHLDKHGSLNVRPTAEGNQVEYLVLSLSPRVHRVRIYRKQIKQDIEVYDMRVA